MSTPVQYAFVDWIETSEGRCLSEIPIRSECFEAQMRQRLESAFEAGFVAGVKSTKEDSL